MNTLNKKEFTIFCVLFVVLLFFYHSEAEAQTPSVTDCLEAEADCEEPGETPPLTEEEDEAEPIAELNDSNSLLFDIIKMFFALLLVLVLIYIMLKLLNKRNKMFNQVRHLENLGGISVGQNKSIQIIRIGDKYYVVGVGDNVELLEEITDEKMKQEMLEQGEEKALKIHTFLPAFLQKKKEKKSADQDGRDFKHLFYNELENLKKNRTSLIDRNSRREDE